jgi:putative membrane protein
MMYGGDGWMWHDGWGGWVLMSAATVALWAVVITVVVLEVRYLASDRGRSAGPRPGPPANRAEDVLAARYARGDIDDEEYRRRLALLHEYR